MAKKKKNAAAVAMAKRRWRKATKAERIAQGKALTEGRRRSQRRKENGE